MKKAKQQFSLVNVRPEQLVYWVPRLVVGGLAVTAAVGLTLALK